MNQIAAQHAHDIGETVAQARGAQALQLLDRSASLVSMGAWSCDLRSERLTWTRGVFDIFGFPPEELPERRATVEIYDEESRELLERTRAKAIETRSGFTLDARIVRPSGGERWVRITAGTQVCNGRAKTLYGMKQDITEERARWDRLRARAECDPLTGVANRFPFQRFLEHGYVSDTAEPVGAMLLFDVDGFKRINDLWGHAAGDACLKLFAERLRIAFPRASLIARIGGDEFAVLLPMTGPRGETEAAVRAVFGRLLSPVSWNGNLLPLSVSAGLAFALPGERLQPESLFVDADKALYGAKADSSALIVCA